MSVRWKTGLVVLLVAAATTGFAYRGFASPVAVPAPRVACIPLAELVKDCESIVIGVTVSVQGSHARVELMQIWKGDRFGILDVSVDRTWACDVSQATVGEYGVYFLSHAAGEEELRLAHSGRGRMPLRVADGVLKVNLGSDIRYMDGEQRLDVRDSECGGLSLPLSELSRLVKQALVETR